MKKSHIFITILIVSFIVALVAILIFGVLDFLEHYFGRFSDSVVDSLPKYQSSIVFGDKKNDSSIDYGKYNFDNLNDEDFEDNVYFNLVSSENIPDIYASVEIVETVLKDISNLNDNVARIESNYDFSIERIKENDYYYIEYVHSETGSNGLKDCKELKVYYFDKELQTLYYFHVNMKDIESNYGYSSLKD